MKITTAPIAPDARTVSVTFQDAGVTHTREVNACFTEDGDYDQTATAERVEEVGRGVAQKIALGVIANTPEPEELPDTGEG